MATAFDDNLKTLLQTFSSGSAGIDEEQFRQDFLPTAPTPPTATAQDPDTVRGNALSVFGAGLAKPIGADESFLGNTANAALAGLDVIGQQRTEANTAAQTLFDNKITAGQLQREQGQAFTNVAIANAQREYYNGLLVNAGLESLLTGDENNDEFMRKVAKDAASMAKNIMELAPSFFSQEVLDRIYFTPDQLYNDILLNLHDVLGQKGSPLQVQAMVMQKIGEQVKYLEIADEAKTLGIDLPANPQEFLDNREFWEEKIKEAQAARAPGSGLGAGLTERNALLTAERATRAAAEQKDLLFAEAGHFVDIAPGANPGTVQDAQSLIDKLQGVASSQVQLEQFTADEQAILQKAFDGANDFLRRAELGLVPTFAPIEKFPGP